MNIKEKKDDLNLREISTFLIFNEDYEEVKKIEENLKKVVNDKKNTNNYIKEEYYFLYLVAKIKLTPVENDDLVKSMNDYFDLIKKIKTECKLDRKISKSIKSENNRNIISHLAYIQKLYNSNYFSDINFKINKIKNDLKLELHKNDQKYINYIKQF
jgi:ribosomal protein S4